MKNWLKARYYLEIISAPIFGFLVFHLSGHGMMLLLEKNHVHENFFSQEFLNEIFSLETLFGLLFLFVFVSLWRSRYLRKWIPCAHTHCSHVSKITHILATLALCLHFFPEAGIRQELFQKAFSGNALSILGMIGFFAHFCIDVIIAGVLSGYWKKNSVKIFSVLSIALVWGIAFCSTSEISGIFSDSTEGGILLGSAFLLAMFVHKPHRN